MARIVTAALILAVLACVLSAPTPDHKKKSKPLASDGSIGIRVLSGGTFGDSSFSISHGGTSSGKGDGGHGGNQGTKSYGGKGDAGHTSYA